MKKLLAVTLAGILTLVPVAKPAYAVLTGDAEGTTNSDNAKQNNLNKKEQVNPAFAGLPYGLAKRETLPPGLASFS
ncbi:MAG: hypothetical protein GX434_05765 [Peptococcaceae bacterium]|nr:hypothetical protein [Peptococcaceae bacterium]